MKKLLRETMENKIKMLEAEKAELTETVKGLNLVLKIKESKIKNLENS